MENMERMPTGIPGFDGLIGGGFVPRSVNLVSGGPGCGKSIFCMQFLWNGSTKFNQPGLFISFEENVTDLKEDAKAFGWDFDSIEHNKVHFMYYHPYDVMDVHEQIAEMIKKTGAKRVVFDSTSVYGMTLESKYEVRKALYELSEELKKHDCVSILTSEIVESDMAGGSKYSRFGVEEFLADSIINISFEGIGEIPRNIKVRKMRRTNINSNVHSLKIDSEGLSVHIL